MTNEPSGNHIISTALGADGKLFSPQIIATGGLGGRALEPPGSDALFSQGVIEISSLGILAVANPGSDTISVFNITESDPSSLKRLGTPVWSRGEFPISVAFNKAGDVLCALNAGFISGISCFNVDKTKGLTPIPDTTRYLHLNQTTPPSGPISGSASQIIFSEDNNLLIVAVKGTNATNEVGYLAVWDVYANHTLSCDFDRVALPSGGFYPYSFTIIPGQNALLASDAALGFDIFNNVSGSMNSSGGHAIGSYAQSIPNQVATCWSTYSSKTGNYYLVDLIGSRITEVSIDENLNSTIVNYYSTGNNTGPLEAGTVSVEGKGFLYVLVTVPMAVDVFSLNGPGNAEHIQRFNYTAYADSAGITIDPNYLAGMATFVKP